MNWQLILQIFGVLAPLAAAIPGIYAIRRQLVMEAAEKKKIVVEAESISADVASKYVDAAGNLQDFYTELIQEVKKQSEECKELVCKLEVKIDILTEENKLLKEEVAELRKQVRELGQEPRFPKGE